MLHLLAFGFGTTELVILLVILLMLFGAGKLPKVLKSLGEGVGSFKKAATDAPESTTESLPAAESAKELPATSGS